MTTPAAASAVRPAERSGLLMGFGAYALWGLFPLYFPLLEPASPLEILAHRFLWSFVFMGLLLTATRSWGVVRATFANRRAMLLLAGATAFIGINWGVYIWAVNTGNVVESSLGYFINPLVLVLFGTLLLGEKLRRLQWVAVGIAGLAVAVLTVGYGRLPWIALVLAFSFGLYALVKKLTQVDPQASLTIETAYAVPFAMVYLGWLSTHGGLTFGAELGNTLLLMAAGIVTAVPLLLFGGAANRVPLSAMGILQYVTPILQFSIGVFVFGEEMPAVRWVGFVIVWIALAVFTIDLVRHSRAQRSARNAEETPATAPLTDGIAETP
jgi:chloramphenicol-sensitive protein RarD